MIYGLDQRYNVTTNSAGLSVVSSSHRFYWSGVAPATLAQLFLDAADQLKSRPRLESRQADHSSVRPTHAVRPTSRKS